MNFLIVPIDSHPTYTRNFNAADHFEDGMIVFNLNNGKHTKDGITWVRTQINNLKS